MALDDYTVAHNAGGQVVGQGILQESQTKNSPLGAEITLNDGRKFHYCLNGATALAAGKMIETPAWATDHTALAVNTAAKGDMTLTITNGASTAITKDMYADGYVFTEDDTGEGQMLKIKSHPAAAVSASCVLTLYDPVRVAFAAATTVGIAKNPFSGTIVTVASGGTETGSEIGVPLIPVTAAYYFWAQSKGIANVLCDGTPAIGTPLMRGSVAGSLALADSSFKEVATQHHTGVDTEYRPVILNIG